MRLFPATVRQRLVTAVTAGALGVGVVSIPLAGPHAWADIKHLRHEQSQAQHSVKHAQADLEESSAETRHAYAALASSKADLHNARHDLRVARAHVKAARHQLQQIRRQLERAKARLERAKAALEQQKQAAADQHQQLVNTVTSFYEGGDPQLMGLVSLLGSATPDDLTQKQANNSLVLDSQDQILSGIKATQVLMKVQTDELTAARDQVARKRAEAAANLAAKQRYQQEAVSAEHQVARTVRERKHAFALARRARAHDRAILARLARKSASKVSRETSRVFRGDQSQ